MMLTAYVHIENGKTVTSKRNHVPPNVICKCPKDVNGKWITNPEVLDILDDIDELTGEVIGKKAVVNQAKLAAYEAAKTQAEQARQDEAAQKQAKIQALKARANDDMKELLELLGL